MKIPDLATTPEGIPIPWVHMNKTRTLAQCCRYRRCWICGDPLTKREAYVVGVATTLSYTVDRPPACPDCARYFLSLQPPDSPILALWICHHRDGYPQRFETGITVENPAGKTLSEFQLVTQLPNHVEWFATPTTQATTDQVKAAIDAYFNDRLRTCPHAEERQALIGAHNIAIAFWAQ